MTHHKREVERLVIPEVRKQAKERRIPQLSQVDLDAAGIYVGIASQFVAVPEVRNERGRWSRLLRKPVSVACPKKRGSQGQRTGLQPASNTPTNPRSRLTTTYNNPQLLEGLPALTQGKGSNHLLR